MLLFRRRVPRSGRQRCYRRSVRTGLQLGDLRELAKTKGFATDHREALFEGKGMKCASERWKQVIQ